MFVWQTRPAQAGLVSPCGYERRGLRRVDKGADRLGEASRCRRQLTLSRAEPCNARACILARKGQHLQSERLRRKAGLAVSQVVVPRADEGVVKAEGPDDLPVGGQAGRWAGDGGAGRQMGDGGGD